MRARLAALVAVVMMGAALPASAGLLDGGLPVLVPDPTQDRFYDMPTGLASVPSGTVLATRPVTVTALTVPATARQVKYVTTDGNGRPTAAITTLLVPILPWAGTGPRPLVSYQNSGNGLATKCSPSFGLRTGIGSQGNTNIAEPSAIASLALLRGFVVSVPDYDSLRNTVTDNRGAAHATLDGLRAVRALLPPSTPMGLWGFNTGASASVGAAQVLSTYAPELPITGLAVAGVFADFSESLRAVSDQPVYSAGLTLIVGGLQRAYPQWHLERELSAYGRQVLASVQGDCLFDTSARYPLLNRAQLEATPGALVSPRVTALIRSVSPIGTAGTPSMPTFVHHGALDTMKPVATTRELVRRFCAAGAPLVYDESPVTDHFTSAAALVPALDFLEARFLGRPMTSTC